MFGYAALLLLSSICYASSECIGGKITDENQAQQWLDDYNERFSEVVERNAFVWWNYLTNITDHNFELVLHDDNLYDAFVSEAIKNASCFDWNNFMDPLTKRQFEKIVGYVVPLEQNDAEKLSEHQNNMGTLYDTGEVCGRPGDQDQSKCYSLHPDLVDILRESRDWDELLWAWKGWRDVTGKHMREDYEKHVVLLNKEATQSGFDDTGAVWRNLYENANFEQELQELFEEIMALYKPLHAYMRSKLKLMYPDNDFPETGHIPAHLLGNMWAQEWNNLIDDELIIPYPGRTKLDVGTALREKNFTVLQLYEGAEEFFVSMGFDELPQSFWDHSLLEKPEDRDTQCHGSAWDFNNGEDFRILFCTELAHWDYIVAYHELGHIYHFIEYKDQPITFRQGPNPAVTEAIGEMIALSSFTPGYLHTLGLRDSDTYEYEDSINYLMLKAFEIAVFLPFGYLVDQWRWNVFSGETKPENYNEAWWDIRCRIQGVSPPVTRSEEDFDPGAKYHVPNDVPYVRYFLALILMFQYQQSLCEAANFAGPLHECSLHGSMEAGDKLREIMRLGSTKTFPELMQLMTNSEKISAAAIIEYFQPLIDWLEEQNEGLEVGWDDECPEGSFMSSTTTTTTADPSSAVQLQLSFSILLIALATIAVFKRIR